MSEILWACRRRWRLIVVAIALALAVGWLTTPTSSSVAQQAANSVSYKATTTLVSDGTNAANLDRLTLLATAGDVPRLVRLQFGDKPYVGGDATVNGQTGARRVPIGKTEVLVTPDKAAGALRISTSDENAARARDIATAVAVRLEVAANQQAQAAYNADYHYLDLTRVGLQQSADDLNNKLNVALATHSPDVGTLDAQHQAALREYEDVQQRILRLEQSKPTGPAARGVAGCDPGASGREPRAQHAERSAEPPAARGRHRSPARHRGRRTAQPPERDGLRRSLGRSRHRAPRHRRGARTSTPSASGDTTCSPRSCPRRVSPSRIAVCARRSR